MEGSLVAGLCIGSSRDIREIQWVSGLADASDTGYFFTSSVGAQAMSGADHSRPNIAMVPEPGERAMLLAGLALVAGAVRHRRHKRRNADALPAKEHMT